MRKKLLSSIQKFLLQKNDKIPFYRQPLFVLILCITVVILVGYRDVFFSGKLLFPSNYASFFYSPWSTFDFEGWGRRIPNKPIGVDLVRFFYPNWEFAIHEVKAGRIPLWNPYIFSGNVFLANFQSAIFYPPNWLYFIIPQYNAWVILHFLPYFLSAIFTYLYARKIKLTTSASLFASLCFAFSGYMIAWMQENTVVPNVASFLPLLLLCTESYLTSLRKKYLLFFSVAWTLAFVAGHFQTAFYCTVCVIIYFIYRMWLDKKYDISQKIYASVAFSFSFLVGIALSAVQLFPSLEAFLHSPRPSVNSFASIEGFLLPVTHFFQLVVTDWYGSPGTYSYFGKGFYHETILSIGIVGLALSLLAILKRKNTYTIFFLGLILISLFLTNDNPLTRLILSQNIPLISSFVPSRILLLTTFSFSILAGIGLNSITYEKKYAFKHFVLILISLLGLIAFANFLNIVLLYLHKYIFVSIPPVFAVPDFLLAYKESVAYVSLKNSVVPAVTVVLLLGIIAFFRKQFVWGVILLCIISQLWLVNKYFMLGEKEFFYPEQYVFTALERHMKPSDRFVSFGNKIFPNLYEPWLLSSPEGLDPIYDYQYGQLINATRNKGKITQDIPRVEALFSDLEKNERSMENIPRYQVMRLTGVKYIAYYDDKEKTSYLPEKTFPEPEYTQLEKKDNWYIFHLNTVLPRAFLADSFIIEENEQRAADAMFAKNFPLQSRLILTESPGATLSPMSKGDSVQLSSYDSQTIVMKTYSLGNKLLFLSDTYSPGWEATIDTKPTKIYRADLSFRAVVVPSGEHTVTMHYRPKSFFYGSILTFLTICSLLALVVIKKLRLKR